MSVCCNSCDHGCTGFQTGNNTKFVNSSNLRSGTGPEDGTSNSVSRNCGSRHLEHVSNLLGQLLSTDGNACYLLSYIYLNLICDNTMVSIICCNSDPAASCTLHHDLVGIGIIVSNVCIIGRPSHTSLCCIIRSECITNIMFLSCKSGDHFLTKLNAGRCCNNLYKHLCSQLIVGVCRNPCSSKLVCMDLTVAVNRYDRRIIGCPCNACIRWCSSTVIEDR